MSYISPDESIEKRLQIAEITISGSPASGSYFTLSIDQHTFDIAPTVSTTELSLPAGSYMFRASLDATRSASSDNYQFQFEVASSLLGRWGQTGIYDNRRSDLAEAAYRDTSNFILKLKAIAVENTAPTLTTDSKIFIWRVS